MEKSEELINKIPLNQRNIDQLFKVDPFFGVSLQLRLLAWVPNTQQVLQLLDGFLSVASGLKSLGKNMQKLATDHQDFGKH